MIELLFFLSGLLIGVNVGARFHRIILMPVVDLFKKHN